MVWRKISEIIKVLFYVGLLILLYIFLLFSLLKITSWVSGSCWLHKLVGSAINAGSDMTAYVIAAATLEFAILTIVQQHITRQQDRALDFPDISIKKFDLIIKPERTMSEVFGRGYADGKYVIKMFFDKSFPVYYKPKIYRAWVRQKKYMDGPDKKYKIKIKFSYFDKKLEYAIWGIQIDDQQCIYDTVVRNQIEHVQSLEFIYDVSWENQLLPWMNRIFSKLYMRLVISLEDNGTRDANGCSINVRGLQIKKASICAPRS